MKPDELPELLDQTILSWIENSREIIHAQEHPGARSPAAARSISGISPKASRSSGFT